MKDFQGMSGNLQKLAFLEIAWDNVQKFYLAFISENQILRVFIRADENISKNILDTFSVVNKLKELIDS